MPKLISHALLYRNQKPLIGTSHTMNPIYRTRWQCLYCSSFATIGENDHFRIKEKISNYSDADLICILTAIPCLNPECRKLSLHLKIEDKTPIPARSPLSPMSRSNGSNEQTFEIEQPKMNYSWQLLPLSKAKIFPSYIPLTIRQDYEEAYHIKDLSPKASATLARRCLQTIIRDFWSIQNKRSLNDEIDSLISHPTVNADLITAFHDLRNIGNIGAHMEKNVDLIIDVEPEEAEVLIKFVESLIDLTYVERHHREQLLKKMHMISTDKKEKKESH